MIHKMCCGSAFVCSVWFTRCAVTVHMCVRYDSQDVLWRCICVFGMIHKMCCVSAFVCSVWLIKCVVSVHLCVRYDSQNVLWHCICVFGMIHKMCCGSAFVCSVWFTQQTMITFLNSNNYVVIVMARRCFLWCRNLNFKYYFIHFGHFVVMNASSTG